MDHFADIFIAFQKIGKMDDDDDGALQHCMFYERYLDCVYREGEAGHNQVPGSLDCGGFTGKEKGKC